MQYYTSDIVPSAFVFQYLKIIWFFCNRLNVKRLSGLGVAKKLSLSGPRYCDHNSELNVVKRKICRMKSENGVYLELEAGPQGIERL